jgi:hypothetical protein
MFALALADAGLTTLISLFFLILGLLTLRRVHLGKYAPEKLAGARTGAWVAFAASGLFLVLAVRELITG